MKTVWKSLIVAGAVLVLLSSLVTAQPMKGEPDKGAGSGEPVKKLAPKEPGEPGGWLLSLAWWLDLTKEQVTQVQAIVEEAQPEAQEAADVVAAAQAALHEAVVNGASEDEIRVAATALGTVIGDQAVLHAQTLAAIKAVLTEEQLKRFDAIKTKLPQLAQVVQKMKSPGGADVKSSKSQPVDKTSKTPTGKEGTGDKSSKLQPTDKTAKTPVSKGDTGDKASAEDVAAALKKLFKAADANKDGVLSMKELDAFLGSAKDDQPAPKK